MSGRTGIQWTDATWNPVVGCNQVSAGCDNCYAKQLHDMRHRAYLDGKKVAPQYAKPFESVQLMQERVNDPLSWRSPKRVFVNSVSDLFHNNVPDFFLDEVFAVMALADRHTFQALTKRAGRMRSYMTAPGLRERIAAAANRIMRESRTTRGFSDALASVFTWRSADSIDPGPWANKLSGIADTHWPLPNVWLGVSVENPGALSRIGALRGTPAAVRFVSFEPLISPVTPDLSEIDWAIVGGESGANARPFDVQWARDLVARCRQFGTAPFVKQLGAQPGFRLEDEESRGNMAPSFHHFDGDAQLYIKRLNDKKGGDMAEWPAELRVREFPLQAVPA